MEGITSCEFRIMTFNVRFDSKDDGDNRWKQRKQKVASIFNFFKVDIAGLQEPLDYQIEELQKELGNSWSNISVGREDGIHKGEHVAIFFKNSKFKLLEQGRFWLSSSPEIPGSRSWDTGYPRVTQWAKFEFISSQNKEESQRNFYLFNTHLDNESQEARINGMALTMSRMFKITEGKYNVFLTGDFNASLEEPEIKQVTKSKEMKMVDAKLISLNGHCGQASTVCGFNIRDYGENGQIDHIFVYDKGQSVRVLSHATVTQMWDKFTPPSDHWPVMADIELGKFENDL